jgi:hypothetical protein
MKQRKKLIRRKTKIPKSNTIDPVLTNYRTFDLAANAYLLFHLRPSLFKSLRFAGSQFL